MKPPIASSSRSDRNACVINSRWKGFCLSLPLGKFASAFGLLCQAPQRSVSCRLKFVKIDGAAPTSNVYGCCSSEGIQPGRAGVERPACSTKVPKKRSHAGSSKCSGCK